MCCIRVWVIASLLATASPVLNSQSSTKKQLPKDYTFAVATEHVWTDTGLDLESGDRVHVYGKVVACEGQTLSEKAHLPLPSAPAGSLLAKLHGESNPILASPDADLPIIENGRLYLGINGWHCHGTISARVHVEWHQSKAPEK
jgi:hypothetical protein